MTQYQVGYHMKASSIIFCLSTNPLPQVTFFGRLEDMFEVAPISLEAQLCTPQHAFRRSMTHGR